MNWEKKIREIADEVAQLELDSGGKYAVAFLDRVREAITKEDYPDEVKRVVSVAGGRPRLVAFKHLGKEYDDAWGRKTNLDSTVVAIGNIVGMDGRMVIWEFPISDEEAMKRKYRFMAITPEEHDVVVKEIEKYINTDVEDKRDTPYIFSLYPLNMRMDSLSPSWNEVAKEMRRKDLQRMIDEKYEYLEGKVKKLEVAIERYLCDFVGMGVDFTFYIHNPLIDETNFWIAKSDVDEVMKGGDNYPTVWAYIKFENGKIVELDAGEFLDVVEEFARHYKEYMDYVVEKKKLSYLIHKKQEGKLGDIPLVEIRVKNFVYMVGYERGKPLKVPKNLAGLVIGKNGETIKKISKLVGEKVRVKEIEPVKIPDGWKSIKITGDVGFVSDAHPVLKMAVELREKAKLNEPHHSVENINKMEREYHRLLKHDLDVMEGRVSGRRRGTTRRYLDMELSI